MAHIRQILANLSISVSEFKKSPKSVIKAVKNEPIAVIIDDKPSFYCVPADILESLYQKFYEMDDIAIQNLQDLEDINESHQFVDDNEDDSFGVNDIFQSIEDEQMGKLSANVDLVDPINTKVADPLDDEVKEQINSNIDQHLINNSHSNNQSSLIDDVIEGDDNLTKDPLFDVDPLDDEHLKNDLLASKAAVQDAIRKAKEAIYEEEADEVRKLVSGPHSFSLEHVAKTYNPYHLPLHTKESKGKKHNKDKSLKSSAKNLALYQKKVEKIDDYLNDLSYVENESKKKKTKDRKKKKNKPLELSSTGQKIDIKKLRSDLGLKNKTK